MKAVHLVWYLFACAVSITSGKSDAASDQRVSETERRQSTTASEKHDKGNDKETASEDDPELELAWLDTLKSGVEFSVDGTARWFDNFFGDNRSFDETGRAQGRLSIEPQWSEYDGFKLGSSLRVEVPLPNTKNRFSAIVGRTSVDDYSFGEPNYRRSSIFSSVQGDEEWILGLGFNPNQGETNRLSFSAGVRRGLKGDLYTQARYLYQQRLTDYQQLRSRTSLFWRDSDGFGVYQGLDWEFSPDPAWLSRYAIDVTRAERIDGFRWGSSAALYHVYAEERAVATEIFYRGETKAEVPVRDYGFRLIHRSRFKRDWLYFAIWSGMHWPRQELSERRRGSWHVGIEFEMWYGD
ncbi:MAG: hypothetical protein M1473_09085 [Firmicutes bacterium]|nr:hypothetical protein [Bacillota bacterium]